MSASTTARAGTPVDQDLLSHGNVYPGDGRTGAAKLLDLAGPATAIFAGSDQQATGGRGRVRSSTRPAGS